MLEQTRATSESMAHIGLMPIVIMVAVVAAALLLAVVRIFRTERSAIPVVGRPLLTKSELAFFAKLRVAVEGIGGHHVCPQVSMGAVMDAAKGLDNQTRMITRNRFTSKVIDFVLMDVRGQAALIVELDDPTHDRLKDARRDAMTAAAGIRTLRISDGRAIDIAGLQTRIRQTMRD